MRLARERARLPHALLLAGPKGLGKNALAAWLAQLLLCAHPGADHRPCGRCQGCTLYAAGSHPDLHVVQPEAVYKSTPGLLAQYALRYPPDKSKDSKDSTVIRIDQIRALIESSQTRPQIAARKVLILSPADSLNVNAANSLLKLLEEPPPDSTLLLVADRPTRLPATIRSRCVNVPVRAPEHGAALAWLTAEGQAPAQAELLLELAAGAPLAALALADGDYIARRAQWMDDIEGLLGKGADPVGCAARWKSAGAERGLAWLQGWVGDLIKLGFDPGALGLFNPDARARLQALRNRLHLNRLFEFLELVAASRNLLGGPLDEQLLLEDVLIQWSRLPRT
ncbi:MAG: DNA polymerase III subunit delta' [Candidatus Muproteobacteria bacterium RBG_16_64_11]|uniref:DNA polymerase III subunit delta' n=1 Tax=Candidatus Muproteobacteria bacterium RBG_16_64_11 TaxID=1817758 RepID=A0A1F6TBF1_9PROT|nr:MAG: DNA polymerase III subunit delta' [Candidatus Muproteobacteria bacterium RBG_16_64_11]